MPWDIRQGDGIVGATPLLAFRSAKASTLPWKTVLNPEEHMVERWSLHFAWSTWWNAFEHARLLTYNPLQRLIAVAPYPAVVQSGETIPLTISQLVMFMLSNHNGEVRDDHHHWILCICGPQGGNWDLFMPVQLFAVDNKTSQAMMAHHFVLGCRNQGGGCGYHAPLWWVAGERTPADPVACFQGDLFIGFPRRMQLRLLTLKVWYDLNGLE
ncbi:hypothetical protein EV421DRAFT_1913142 [Armillaria borealis]|uniref:Uncharacterized protein n=1 Tax=Armillaria borealis TaxID=47425 RepID=A0AA39ITK5_9AGAR|nr:hypothetical protein EV421DRAFT_1913142 [Armillaria borealis]